MRPHELKNLTRGQRLLYVSAGQKSEVVTLVRIDEEFNGPYVAIVVRDVEQRQLNLSPQSVFTLPGGVL